VTQVCSRPEPHERIEAPSILTLKPAPEQATTPPRFSSGNAEVSLAVAVKISSSFRKHSIRSTGHTTELVEDSLPLATNLVNLSDFRRCDLERLLAYLFVRTPYMVSWCRKFKSSHHVALIPNFLYSLADCLLRTQRLNEMVGVLRMDLSYEATKKANALAKQLFLGICEAFLYSNQTVIQLTGDHFADEDRWIARRLSWIEESLLIRVPEPRNLGEMSEVMLLDSTPIVGHQESDCVAVQGGITLRSDCSSIESRCSIDETLPLPKPLFHLARGIGRGSSAASKYYQMLCEDRMGKLQPNVVVSLADGCGGVLAMLLHLYPLAHGVFNTLMNEEVLGIAEPSMYVHSALIGCGLVSRLLNLPRSKTGLTDITKAATQEKVVSICHSVIENSEVLVTMDAESSHGVNWTSLLVSTLTIVEKIPFQRKTAIIKLIIPAEELVLAMEFVIVELASLGNKHKWAKPITSHSRNNEIFLIASNWLQLNLNLPESVKYACYLASSIANIGEFIRVGLRLKSVALCLNIARRNLKELNSP